jgi:hypothetical protein
MRATPRLIGDEAGAFAIFWSFRDSDLRWLRPAGGVILRLRRKELEETP